MRNRLLIAGAALGAMIALQGCASTIGKAAGYTVGGAAWVGVKGSKLAWKGGKLAAKTTGRTVKGAATGIHDEFSKPGQSEPQTQTLAQSDVRQASQRETADLPY